MVPQGGGQAGRGQIQRAQQEGLDGVAILVDQHPPGDVRVRNLAATVLGRFVGKKDKRSQGQAGVQRVLRDHRAMEAEVGAPPVAQIDRRSRRRLEQPPGALDQKIKRRHLTRSLLASSPSGVTWAVS